MSTKTKKTVKKEVVKFDYTTIKSFEDSCNNLGIDASKLPDVANLLPEFTKPIIAHYKLMIIYKAINNGWTPDWNDNEQYKYFPWFRVLSSGFGFSHSNCDSTYTITSVGSRLCTNTREKALYIAKQFEAEYRDYLLFSQE